MRILLIQPPSFVGNALALYLNDYSTMVPQLGLLYVAAALQDHDVRLLDLNREQTTLTTVAQLTSRVVDECRTFQPDLAGVGTMANVYPLSLHLARALKELNPGLTVVFGGHQASFTAEETLRRFRQVDLVVVGEGEQTFSELARVLEQGGSPARGAVRKGLEGLEGIAYRRDAEGKDIIFTQSRPLVKDLEDLGPPAYHLIPPLEQYQPDSLIKRANILTSRGCPHECSFCSVSPFWRRQVRFREPEKIVDELFMARDDLGARFIEFNDDTFTVSRRMLEKVCRLIIDRGLDVEWLCRARVGSLDDESASLMRQAGCTHVFLGAESGSERILKYMKKALDPNEVVQSVRRLSTHGIETIVSFIYGFPVETAEDIRRSVRVAIECRRQGARWLSFQRLTALPGTGEAEKVTDEFNVAGAYVSGSPILADPEFLEQTRRMVSEAPSVFPSFFRVRMEHFPTEQALMETVGAALRPLNREGGMFL